MPSDPGSVVGELECYIRKEFLDADASAELSVTTPLLEWGILNSMSTAYLAGFIQDRFDVAVPPSAVTAANFRDIASISAMVTRLLERPDAVQ
jgi:clorobiocin biosynthesis protein CloN5